MPRRRKRRKAQDDPLKAYRRIRKPMPPPDQVIPDRRGDQRERIAQREAEEDREERERP